MFYKTIAVVAMLAAQLALARPVSYPDGITFMQMNNADRNNVHIHYSPTVKYSVGYKGEYWRDDGWQFHGAQLNNLIKRWNRPSAQANFYFKTGLGIVTGNRHASGVAGFTGIALDAENRRFFSAYENRYYDANSAGDFFTQQARLGVAPYIGDYGDLHTWLIVQVDHQPESDETITITPMIRLFKHEYLAEIGVSDNGDAMLNLIIRY